MPMGLAKHCRLGSQQGMQPVFIAAFTEDPSLCPLLCLQQYDETTKELRPKDDSQLLIATVAPHKPVVSSTIARWLKEVLNACVNLPSPLHKGDINICSGHGWCHDPDHYGTGRMVTTKYLLQILLP